MSAGVSAVMSHESPRASVASLRRVAALDPARMLTGHGGSFERPRDLLLRKADAIEAAAERVVALHQRGLPERVIALELLPHGKVQDVAMDCLTQGEFSRLCFVRACLREAANNEHGA